MPCIDVRCLRHLVGYCRMHCLHVSIINKCSNRYLHSLQGHLHCTSVFVTWMTLIQKKKFRVTIYRIGTINMHNVKYAITLQCTAYNTWAIRCSSTQLCNRYTSVTLKVIRKNSTGAGANGWQQPRKVAGGRAPSSASKYFDSTSERYIFRQRHCLLSAKHTAVITWWQRWHSVNTLCHTTVLLDTITRSFRQC